MIVEIDGIYFNPLQITTMWEKTDGGEVRVYFSDSIEECIIFNNWKVSDLASRINELIEEFNKK